MTKKDQHVIPHETGWAVRPEGGKIADTFPTKEAAEIAARATAIAEGNLRRSDLGRHTVFRRAAGLLRGLGLGAGNALDKRHNPGPRFNLYIRLDMDPDGGQVGAGRADPRVSEQTNDWGAQIDKLA